MTSEDRVLVLAPIGNDADVTVRILEGAGMAAEKVRDTPMLVEKLAGGAAALILAEEAIGDQSVQLLLEYLKKQASWSDIPMIIITSRGAETTALYRRLTAFGSAGNVTLLERPFRPLTLVNAAQVAKRSRHKQYDVRDLLAEREGILANLEATIRERTSELRETNAQLEELVYSIAHDLRAPLRAMQGFSKLLVDLYGESLDEEGRGFAVRVMQAAEKMDAMTLDLLAYGRIARSDVRLQPVMLTRVWKAAMAQCERLIDESRGIVTIEEKLPVVQGEEPILTQVCANLLNNALKFVPPGQRPEVRVRGEVLDGTARIWVEDNGIGIAARHQERIFRVFERLDGAAYPGTGIGLSIVRKGIERMGGRVGVASEAGKGSRFWIELPVSQAA